MTDKKTRAAAWREYLNVFAFMQISNHKDRDGNLLELTKQQATVVANNAARMATALTGYDPNIDTEEATQQ